MLVRLRNPVAVKVQLLHDFFVRAFDQAALAPDGFEANQDKIAELVVNPYVHFLVASEGPDPKGLAILQLTPGETPQVGHFYNEGSLSVKKELITSIVETVRASGADKFLAINSSGAPDSVWARTFRRAGKSRKIGSIMEFDL